MARNLNRNSELDNLKFFFGEVRTTEILTNFSLALRSVALEKDVAANSLKKNDLTKSLVRSNERDFSYPPYRS